MNRAVASLFALGVAVATLGAQSVSYTVPAKGWDASLGSHRIVVRAEASAGAVRAHLDWRRRDPEPEKHGVVVVDAKTGERLKNVLALNIGSETGEVVFEPVSGAGEYLIYYLPGDPGRGAFPSAKYLPAGETAAPAWLAGIDRTSGGLAKLPGAQVVRWEARTEHDRFTEMEIIATQAECDAWLALRTGAPFAVFPETRERAVRMFDHVPELWLKRDAAPEFTPRVNEFFPFQLGLWAARGELRDVQVVFSELVGDGGARIPATSLRCLQCGGVDWKGAPFQQRIDLPAGRIQSLWCALDLGAEVKPGHYTGMAEIRATGLPPQRVPLTFTVDGPALADRGDSEPARLAKLRWLDSTIAQDDTPTRGFPPLAIEGRVVRLLGRAVTLGENGLPVRITSYFHPGVTKLVEQPTEILGAPMQFVVELADGAPLPLTASDFHLEKSPAGGAATWSATLKGDAVTIDVQGRLEFDGHTELRCMLRTTRPIAVRDVRLEIPRTAATTPMILGLGHYGGATPSDLDWKWDVAKKHQDAVWLGAVNAGLRVQPRAENYVRPYVNIHYVRQPLNAPASWDNAGRGGIRFMRDGKDAGLSCFSGARTLDPAQPLHFDFDLSITPFRMLDTAAQWRDRYYHVGGVTDPAKIRETGANVVNIHQGNALNPFINYPFLTADKLRDYAAKVHAEGMRVKYYYTVRELTNLTPELFAARAFGSELIARGQGAGHAWCEEHLGGEYWQAWAEPATNDASILTASLGRWNNLYLEGLDWLVKNAGCDGLYLDDISFDRTVMKRARKILDRAPELQKRGGGLIDLHSWNEARDARAGYASCALLFMDSFPFVDRLWFGEGHPYDGPPEQTLAAISGIPFGLMGEMLQGGGNPWLGLTFGMTNRLGWQGDPRAIWKLWDDFGVREAEFIGWWDSTSPVQTDVPGVKATIWKKPGRTLVVVGNFGDQSVRTRLAIDWPALGLHAEKASLFAPEMPKLQPELVLRPGDPIAIAAKRSLTFILDETPRERIGNTGGLAFDQAKLIFDETFTPRPRDGWKEVTAAGAESVKPDKEGLVFLAPANSHAWAEHALPAGAAVIAAQLRQDAGDAAQQWGPGLALVWPDGKFLKANRRRDGRFGLSVNGAERLAGICDIDAPVTIAFILGHDAVRIVATGAGTFQQDEELATIPRVQFSGVPATMRVGKMSNTGQPQDHLQRGETGWSRCDWVRVYQE
ncbi:MAG: hypothetical protein QOE70_4679 [Chthoniobacter sp.]|jgi:hypothetical protein|nr:hypothetical protein [Chthoniobacter sp.]